MDEYNRTPLAVEIADEPISEINGNTYYRLLPLNTQPNLIEIDSPRGSKLRVSVGTWIHWGLFQFGMSDADASNVLYNCEVYGSGSAGLREARHTHFGQPYNPGYVHSINGDDMIWLFGQLKTWFDLE